MTLLHVPAHYRPENHVLYNILPVAVENMFVFPTDFLTYNFDGDYVYFLRLEKRLRYIGHSTSIETRFPNHKSIKRVFDEFCLIRGNRVLEQMYIRVYKPPDNTYLKKG